jgi:hypothetical protein
MTNSRKFSFIGVLFLGSLLVVYPAHAKITGNDLLRFCTSDPNSVEQSYCLGYLSGLMDGVMAANILAAHPQIFDAPQGADVLQVRDIVVKSLQQSPKDRHLEAVVLVMRALKEAFPPKPSPTPTQ